MKPAQAAEKRALASHTSRHVQRQKHQQLEHQPTDRDQAGTNSDAVTAGNACPFHGFHGIESDCIHFFISLAVVSESTRKPLDPPSHQIQSAVDVGYRHWVDALELSSIVTL